MCRLPSVHRANLFLCHRHALQRRFPRPQILKVSAIVHSTLMWRYNNWVLLCFQ